MEAKKIFEEEMIDCIFCDINMPDLDGMSFVKGLAAPPAVVFTTAYSEYAVEGYKVDAVDYLLKPYSFDEFRHAAEKVQRNKYGGKLPDAVGIPEEQLRKAAKSAVCKINIDSDSRLAYTAGVRETLALHPEYFDPRQYGKVARAYMTDMYKEKITDVLGSDHKLVNCD